MIASINATQVQQITLFIITKSRQYLDSSKFGICFFDNKSTIYYLSK